MRLRVMAGVLTSDDLNFSSGSRQQDEEKVSGRREEFGGRFRATTSDELAK